MSPDPYGQYHSPYLAMGNSPTNSVDPDGGYSKFGAWWRNGGSMNGVSEVGGEWGFDNADAGMWQFADDGIAINGSSLDHLKYFNSLNPKNRDFVAENKIMFGDDFVTPKLEGFYNIGSYLDISMGGVEAELGIRHRFDRFGRYYGISSHTGVAPTPSVGGISFFKVIRDANTGLKVVKVLGYKDAIKHAKNGGDVYTATRSAAKTLTKKISGGGKVIEDSAHGVGYYKHFHDLKRALGHIFFGTPKK